MYVETDFLIALTSPDDWLHDQAVGTLRTREDVHTSLISYLEFLVQAYDPGTGVPFDVPHVVANLLEEVPIDPQANEAVALAAATYLDEHSITPFDAFHGAISAMNDEEIHSSDQVYDDIGLTRVPLEPSRPNGS